MSEKITYNLHQIPNGVEGIRKTLKIMSKVVKAYKASPAIRELALSLTRDLQQKSYKREVERIHAFVRDEIRYIKDIKGIETIQTPIQTLRLRSGDCDDKSSLAASLLESIGHPTRFVAVGFTPDSLCHVFVQTKIGKEWISVECTENVKLGWRPPKIKKVMLQNN